VVFMGRIKTSFVKHVSRDLMEKHAELFTQHFEQNKKILAELIDFESKRMRNIVAGYITTLKKR